MRRLAHTLALFGSLVAFSLVGCNAALGIDEARLRDDGSVQSTSTVIPVAGCDSPHTGCGTCVASSNAYVTCLADHTCRKALDAYRECLGSKCDSATCFEGLAAGAGQKLASVVHTECPMCEGTSPLASMCDLFCACMQQPLPPPTVGSVADGKTCETYDGTALPWTAGSLVECKTACETLAKTDLASVNCRWGHCELPFDGESRGHCQHAIDESICPLSAVANPDCKDKRLVGWACPNGKQDCCSGHCSPDRICVQ